MTDHLLNTVYSKPTMQRRYEVWFLRFMLADGSGAWWFRYLMMNPGRPGGGGCPENPLGHPIQLWATWFPRDGIPRSFIQGFPRTELQISDRGVAPFFLRIGHDSRIDENSCTGRINADGHVVTWNLRYRSTFSVSMTEFGWIGFSRTPHSDAVFSGEMAVDGAPMRAEPLGYGLQGHNSGFRHRDYWNWTHCLILNESGDVSTFEALEYEISFGLQFRRALLWHKGTLHSFTKLQELTRDRMNLQWALTCANSDGDSLVAVIDGSGQSIHRLPYLKTNCSSTFEVANNSLARATLIFTRRGQPLEQLTTDGGGVLEMVGE